MTNAVKAQLISLANAVMGVLVAFNVALTSAQQAAIMVLVNAALLVWVAVTYKNSPKRIPDA